MAKIFANNEWLPEVTQVFDSECDNVTLRHDGLLYKAATAGFIMDAPDKVFMVKFPEAGDDVEFPERKNNPSTTQPLDISILDGSFILNADDSVDRFGGLYFGKGNGLALTMQRSAVFKITGRWALSIAEEDNDSLEASLYDHSRFEINVSKMEGIAGRVGGEYNLYNHSRFVLDNSESIKMTPFLQNLLINLCDNATVVIITDELRVSRGELAEIRIGSGSPVVEIRSQTGKSDPFGIEDQDLNYPRMFNFSEHSTGRVIIDVPDGYANAFGLSALFDKKLFSIDGRAAQKTEFTIDYGKAARNGEPVSTISLTLRRASS